MTEIEPTIENVQLGDVVTIETGTPGVPGHESGTYWAASEWSNSGAERSLYTLRALTRIGWRITRITRLAVRVTEEGDK